MFSEFWYKKFFSLNIEFLMKLTVMAGHLNSFYYEGHSGHRGQFKFEIQFKPSGCQLSCLPESLQSEYLSVRYPESLHHLQFHRNPVSRVVAQFREVVVDGLGVNLNIIVLSDEIHLFELALVVVVKSNADLFWEEGINGLRFVSCINLSNSIMNHQDKRTNQLVCTYHRYHTQPLPTSILLSLHFTIK